MKLVWSPDAASKAYLSTIQTCKNFKEPGEAELLSAMAAGWDSKLIVETWSQGGSTATSIGLGIAAQHTCGRHVCIVPDDVSRSDYMKSMHQHDVTNTEVIVGGAEVVVMGLSGRVDFLVVDCKMRSFLRVLRSVTLSDKGGVLACKNAFVLRRFDVRGFWWRGALGRGTRVLRSVFLPVGSGLDVAHVGSCGVGSVSRRRWVRHVDQYGEEHVFRRY